MNVFELKVQTKTGHPVRRMLFDTVSGALGAILQEEADYPDYYEHVSNWTLIDDSWVVSDEKNAPKPFSEPPLNTKWKCVKTFVRNDDGHTFTYTYTLEEVPVTQQSVVWFGSWGGGQILIKTPKAQVELQLSLFGTQEDEQGQFKLVKNRVCQVFFINDLVTEFSLSLGREKVKQILDILQAPPYVEEFIWSQHE